MAAIAAVSASGPRAARSSTIMRKPPAVPTPRTGGGTITSTSASSIAASFCCSARWIAGADFAGSLARAANGSSTRNMVPEFGALVKVAPEKPTKFTARATPGTVLAISVIRRLTASVRPSAAPPGSCATTIR